VLDRYSRVVRTAGIRVPATGEYDEIHNLQLSIRVGAEVSDMLKYFSAARHLLLCRHRRRARRLLSGTRGEQVAGRFTLIPAAASSGAPSASSRPDLANLWLLPAWTRSLVPEKVQIIPRIFRIMAIRDEGM